MSRVTRNALATSIAIAAVGGIAIGGCTPYSARTLLERGPGAIAIGDLDVAIELRDATSYFDAHPLRHPTSGLERPVLERSVIATVMIGNASAHPVAARFAQLRFEAVPLNGAAAPMQIFDPRGQLVPKAVDVETSGRERLRVDAPMAVGALRAIVVHLDAFTDRAGDADPRLCFVRGDERTDASWTARPCGPST